MFHTLLVVLLAYAFPGPAAGARAATTYGLTDRRSNIAAAEEDDVALLQTATLVKANAIAYSGQQHQSPQWPGIRYVGAGLSRTGTESMIVAMTILGEHPTHGEEFKVDGSSEKLAIVQAGLGFPADMLAKLEHENATSVFDSPLNMFLDLFRKRFDSKVILNIHPHGADGFVKSIVNFSRYWALDSAYQTPPFFSPMPLLGCIINVSPNATITDEMRQDCKTSYEEYNARIISSVPQNRLLVYNVSTGWGPLCEFLGVTQCPYGTPFPHIDNVADKRQQLCHSICRTNVSKCVSTVDGKPTQSVDNDRLLARIPEEARYPCAL